MISRICQSAISIFILETGNLVVDVIGTGRRLRTLCRRQRQENRAAAHTYSKTIPRWLRWSMGGVRYRMGLRSFFSVTPAFPVFCMMTFYCCFPQFLCDKTGRNTLFADFKRRFRIHSHSLKKSQTTCIPYEVASNAKKPNPKARWG